jgi:hypothetical protein
VAVTEESGGDIRHSPSWTNPIPLNRAQIGPSGDPVHVGRLAAWRRLSMRLGVPLALAKHPDQRRSEDPILLAVDEELGEGATLRVAPELSDPVGPLEVGEA